jgi:hypothetical protein
MKRIVRLTESDLARIVRRVISEGTVGDSVFDNITNLIKTANIGNWWNKSAILNELKKLKACQDYTAFTMRVKKRGFDYASDWIRSTLDTNREYDSSQAAYISNPLKGLGTGLTDEEFNSQLAQILSGIYNRCKSQK